MEEVWKGVVLRRESVIVMAKMKDHYEKLVLRGGDKKVAVE